jgi:hypothetical protein
MKDTICCLIGKFTSGLQGLGKVTYSGMHITIVDYYVAEKENGQL